MRLSIGGRRAEARALESSAPTSAGSRRRATWIALLVLAVIAAWWLRDPHRREDAVDVALAPFGWRSHAASHPTRNGGVILGWKPAPGAKTYVVLFRGADGKVVDWINGIETREVVLTREALPRHLTPGADVRWNVVALDGSREIGRSRPAELRLP